jgi:hypothetical protein
MSNKLSTWQIIKIYVGSVLLSPFSLYWFFKYYKDVENKRIAYISLVITVVSLGFGLIVSYEYIKAITAYSQLYSF